MWPWLILLLVLLGFQFVVLRGEAPYLRTLRAKRRLGLDLLELKPGQTILDLGCGDGSVLIDAAGRGLKAVGYEVNPVLAVIARLRTRKYGDRVEVVWGNFWKKDWPEADGIFVFLHSSYMGRLDTAISRRYKKGIKMVTYAFPVRGRKPAKKAGAFFLYKY